MADATQKRSGPRVVVQVSEEMQFLLTQVAARMLVTKRDLHTQIWCAGVAAHLGVTPEEVDEARLTSLPRSANGDDPKLLAKMMIAGR